MTNYDGPAFFRRRLTRSKSQNKEQPGHPNANRLSVPRRVSRPQSKLSNSAVRDDEVPAFLKEIKNFQPKRRPKNAVHKKQVMPSYFVNQTRRQKRLYERLTDQLRVDQDELIVIGDQTKTTEGQATKTASSIHTPSPYTYTADLQKVDQTAKAKKLAKSDELPKTIDHQTKRTNLLHHSQENHPQLRRGLGQSLAAIVSQEQRGSKSLALFDDNPQPKENERHLESADQQQPATLNSDTQTNNDLVRRPPAPAKMGYSFPPVTLLNLPTKANDNSLDEWIEHQIDVLDKTFKAFKVDAEVVDWTNGPTVTQFQVKLALGVKVSRITNLTDDLKLALAAKDIRIEAPIPGKSTVGIEIPNPHPRPVLLSEILTADNFKQADSPLTTALGVDLAGTPRLTDIRKMPHGLIAGATGSGKSVFINSLLVSLLFKATPAELKLLLIDPKAVELAPYDGIPHLLSPVISDPQSAAAALKWLTQEMDNRYEKLSAAGVRNIEQFNKQADQTGDAGLKMPYILVIIDELADLMMVASNEVEDAIVRITQKARAAGIHLIVATQRPSVDVVTGTIKNNIPTRIAFMVASQVDSRTILDTSGAEQLFGRGDMLYLGSGANTPNRLQGAFVTNQELTEVIDYVRKQGTPNYLFTPDSLKQTVSNQNSHDRLMPQVMKFIAQEETISTSKLQRVFSIGYNRAANIIDDLQARHLVSEQQGAKPRSVYYNPSDRQNGDDSADDTKN